MNNSQFLEPTYVQGFAGSGASQLAVDPSSVFSFLWMFGLVLCVVAAGVIAMIGGTKYVAATSANLASEAKADIRRAIFGVIGVLGLWLVLNQVNPDLLRGDITIEPIQQSSSTPIGGDGGGGATSTPITSSGEALLQRILQTEDQNRAFLSGININNGPCRTLGQTGCTNVGGLDQNTLNMLRSLRLNVPSSGNITITGGTEWWLHGNRSTDPAKNTSSHTRGTAVDLKLVEGDALYKYITEGRTRSSASFCNAVYIVNGWRFCDEKGGDRHWHVYN